MGCNYYLRIPERAPCPCCGRPWYTDELHIGKSSAGWCFGLHVIPDEGINDLPDWERKFGEGRIYDEYGEEITAAKMVDIISKRGKPGAVWENGWWQGYNSENDFHSKNHSQRGPNGMLRCRISDGHCIGHGAGTWDLITGEFS